MNELLLAYFDRPLSAEESAELSTLLESDPIAAHDFATLSKVDVAMERHFAHATKADTLDSVEAVIGRHVERRQPIIRPTFGQFAMWGTVAAVLALLGFVVTLLLHEPDLPRANAKNAVDDWSIPEPPIVPGSESFSFAQGMNREERLAAARLRARLDRFYLPNVSFRGMTLDSALGEIGKAMAKSDHRGWLAEEPVSLTIAGSEPGIEGKNFTLVKGNLSAVDALKLLAIQAGKQLVFHASGVELSDFSEDAETPLMTRTFSIPQEHFNRRSPYVWERNPGVTLEVDPVVGSDGFTIDLSIAPEVIEFEGFVNYGSPITLEDGTVFGPHTEVAITNSTIKNPIFSTRRVMTPAMQFENWGVTLDEDSRAEWIEEVSEDADRNQLTVTTRMGTMDRIATLLNAVNDEPTGAAMVTVETKVFEVPEAMAIEDTLLDATERHSFLRGLVSNSEVVSVSYPGVTTRNGRSVLVESTVQHSVNPKIASGEVLFDKTGYSS